MQERVIGVVGNPNCGKTTLFNALTGAKQTVGNWPGVTVERKTGLIRYDDKNYQLVDLPGTYSLDPDAEASLDERLARDFVARAEADVIVNIVDASNIERNLYLTCQLLEMQVPVLVVLNMMDAARDRGLDIDASALAETLSCPVVPVVAASGEGVEQLKRALRDLVDQPTLPTAQVPYDPAIESALVELLPQLPEGSANRWQGLGLLEAETPLLAALQPTLKASLPQLRDRVSQSLDEDIDIAVADARYNFINRICQQCVYQRHNVGRQLSDRIDSVVLNRLLGIPVFLLIMYLMFMFTINIGGAFIDFFDLFSAALLVDGPSHWLSHMGLPEWLVFVLADGIGGGLQIVATFIPVIAFLYLFLSALEDSGYMARAAFVMDRAMRAIGLPGKAFVPLIVGFGCNVPAVMATRTMEQERDRILTIMMVPFMSCGARLPVYALFAAAFFPAGGQNVVFGLYLIGILVAIMTGFIMKTTLLQGATTPFVMELPSYHIPTPKGVLMRTWERTQSFVLRAGKVIVPMVLVLNVMNAIDTQGNFGNQDSENSVLSAVGRTLVPVFTPMGIEQDNWPATVGIVTGVLAKEAVVGTLDALYSNEDEAANDPDSAFDLGRATGEALATIPANLGAALDTWRDPLGVSLGDTAQADLAAEAQEVQLGTFGTMQQRFDGAAGAFAYLLLILLYFPCVATLAAVYREVGAGWAWLVALWTSGLGYLLATVFYQLANFTRQPASAITWSILFMVCLGAAVTALTLSGRYRRRHQSTEPPRQPPQDQPAC